jgi:hypothetical protein
VWLGDRIRKRTEMSRSHTHITLQTMRGGGSPVKARDGTKVSWKSGVTWGEQRLCTRKCNAKSEHGPMSLNRMNLRSSIQHQRHNCLVTMMRYVCGILRHRKILLTYLRCRRVRVLVRDCGGLLTREANWQCADWSKRVHLGNWTDLAQPLGSRYDQECGANLKL